MRLKKGGTLRNEFSNTCMSNISSGLASHPSIHLHTELAPEKPMPKGVRFYRKSPEPLITKATFSKDQVT